MNNLNKITHTTLFTNHKIIMSKHRSFLKWAGGKYNCLNKILATLPTGKRLIEPFAGSGVVSLNATYPAYLLGESNGDVVHLYKYLQKEGQEFINYCQTLFIPEHNNKGRYYQFREEFNITDDIKRKSALFLFLNRHGYNGLCRYNSKGHYNVPFGTYKTPYFPLNEMHNFIKQSKTCHFIQSDFRDTFKLAKVGDVIYCDPPYVSINEKTKPVPYTKQLFTEMDQVELAELAKETASKGIPVIISNHDVPLTRKIYEGAKIDSFSVSRFINCQADHRQPVKELIAIWK